MTEAFISALSKPNPYSNPFTALILNIALPRSACNLSKTGSPSPAGQLLIKQVIIPPVESPSSFKSSMSSIIFSEVSGSGHLTSEFSIVLKLSSSISFSIFTVPICETKASISIPF